MVLGHCAACGLLSGPQVDLLFFFFFYIPVSRCRGEFVWSVTYCYNNGGKSSILKIILPYEGASFEVRCREISVHSE